MDLKEILTWQTKCGKKKEEKQQASNPFSLTFFKKKWECDFFFSGNIKNVNSHHLCRTIPVRLHGEALKVHLNEKG